MRKRRARQTFAFALILGAVVYLISIAFGGSTAFYVTVEEALAAAPQQLGERGLRIQGTVDGESIQWDIRQFRLEFAITDASGVHRIPVVYHGARPDNFEGGKEVVVEGRFAAAPAGGQGSVFEAHTLMVRCPSRYEAEVPEEAA